MPKVQNDTVFELVKSLSKSEKRQFKLYSGRLGANEHAKFIVLFDLLDKMSTYSEEVVLKHPDISKRQLSNLKAHLYKQILISLRLNPTHQSIRVQIREHLDYATILYHKGLYNQSLKLLEKAKVLSLENEEKNMAYEILELEKVIEAQYITRSISNRAHDLTVEAAALSELNVLANTLSNLSLELYGIFLKKGYVKNNDEFEEVTEYFHSRIPEISLSELGFREKLWWYKAHLWYSFLVQDFLSCYKYALRWVNLFYEYPKMIVLNPVFFIRGKQYLLEALFFIGDIPRFEHTLIKFQKSLKAKEFPVRDNVQSLAFLYSYTHQLNLHFMKGSFEDGLQLIDPVLKGIETYKTKIDAHHIMVFYYKIACLYFGVGENKKCIFYLNKIISNKQLEMREDLLCFSRILNLVAHYEAGADYHLDSLIRSTYKFLLKMEDLYQVQKEMISFLRGLGDIYPHQIKNEFKKLYTVLKALESDPYERRSFLYLDILSWLKSHIEGRPIPEIIQEKNQLKTNLF